VTGTVYQVPELVLKAIASTANFTRHYRGDEWRK
jgi:hypothetical protein